MFCRQRERLVFHRRAQPSERGNNPFMYFSCSLTTPVGVLFVLSSSVCLIFPLSLSLSLQFSTCSAFNKPSALPFLSLPKLLPTTESCVCHLWVCVCLLPQSNNKTQKKKERDRGWSEEEKKLIYGQKESGVIDREGC